MTNEELTIRQIGEFCANTICSKCPIKLWNDARGLHNECMESLRLSEVATIMLAQIKDMRIDAEGSDD